MESWLATFFWLYDTRFSPFYQCCTEIMSALLLQTILLGFVCHGDLYFSDLSCADCPLYFWAHVLANCTNLLISLLSDICCNTLTQHNLTCSDSCAFPSHKHRLVHMSQSVRVKSCHTTVTVSLQVTCNAGDTAVLQENHTNCKRERITKYWTADFETKAWQLLAARDTSFSKF